MAAKTTQDRVNGEDFVLDPNVKRHIHLDMMRVLAIMFVAVDHGNPKSKQYSINNVLFTQSWVLQLLWVVSGISFSLSKARLVSYNLRLVVYLMIGTSCNWMAWVITGKDWRHDPLGVIYQMAFIVALIFYGLFTACLKPSLQRIKASRLEAAGEDSEIGTCEGSAPSLEMRGEEMHGISRGTLMDNDDRLQPSAADLARALSASPTSAAEWGNPQTGLNDEERRAASRFGGILAMQLLAMGVTGVVLTQIKSSVMQTLFNFLLGKSCEMWTRGLDDREFFGQFLGTAGMFLLVVAGTKLLRSHRLAPWLSWVLIAYVYMNRILLLPVLFRQYGGGVARFFSGFELFVIGLVANTMGLKYAGALKRWVGHYWLLLFVANGFIWGPAWHERMDEHPPHVIVTVFRVQVCELSWVVSFLAAGSLMFTEEAWPAHIRNWLCSLATVLFLVHKAIHLTVPQPFNWILIYIVLPLLFWLRAHGPPAHGVLKNELCIARRPPASVELPMTPRHCASVSGTAASHGMPH